MTAVRTLRWERSPSKDTRIPSSSLLPSLTILLLGILVTPLAGQLPTETVRLLRHPKGCVDSSDCIPVVFIHGINGTSVEPGDPACPELGDGSLDALVENDHNWRPLWAHLQTQEPDLWHSLDIYVFRYISNKDTNVAGMATRLRQLAEEKKIAKPFLIVAHSMGGLVARAFLERPFGTCQAGTDCRKGYELVNGVITLGTPHHGSPFANRLWRDYQIQRYAGATFPLSSLIDSVCDVGSPRELLSTASYGVFLGAIENLSPGARASCWFSIADWIFWGKLGGAPAASTSAHVDNRIDLLWDNYDGFFDEPKSKYNDQPSELNAYLAAYTGTESARKLIVYGGVTSPALSDSKVRDWLDSILGAPSFSLAVRHKVLTFVSWLLSEKIGKLVQSDGVVPLDSALFLFNPNVAVRRNLLAIAGTSLDFDHFDIKGNPSCDVRQDRNGILFPLIASDLRSLKLFSGLPPAIQNAAFTPKSAPAGAQFTLDLRLKTTNANLNRVSVAVRFPQSTTSICSWQSFAFAGEDLTRQFTGEFTVPAAQPQPSANVLIEVWPASAGDPCRQSPGQRGIPSLTLPFTILPPPVVPVSSTVSLTLAPSGKSEFRLGESFQISYTVKATPPPAGVIYAPLSPFVWFDGPSGRRFLAMDPAGVITESSTPRPASPPVAPVSHSASLPAVVVDSSVPAGTYTWQASLMRSEVFADAGRVAQAPPVSYKVVADRLTTPSVLAVSTTLNRYLAGDTMVISYSTMRGTASGTHDLMLRLTSQATGKDYYFYDNPSDSNRWIHTTPKPMWTGTPIDGRLSIPAAGQDPILIEDTTPSGTYRMTMYFSLPGQNQPVGPTAEGQFILETPTAEGGCFVATAAYGSPMAPAVQLLRRFRDSVLIANVAGRRLVSGYYDYGPILAHAIAPHRLARKALRTVIWPLTALAAVWLFGGPWLSVVAFGLTTLGVFWLWRRARLTLFVLLLAGVALAGDIRGVVLRSQPFPGPLAGAQIRMEGSSRTASSAQDGSFSFTGLSPSSYKLQVTLPGFMATTMAADIATSSGVATVVVLMNPVAKTSYVYYLPHTAESDGWWTFFAVVNPNATAAEIRMEAFAADGSFLGVSEKLTSLGIDHQVNGAPSDFFPSPVVAKAAWYRLTASSPVAAFEIFGHQTGTMASFPLPEASGSKLYLPHIAQDSQWWTGVSFVSAAASTSSFVMQARSESGALLAEAASPVVLTSGEKTVDVISKYFGYDFPLDIRWVQVRSGGPLVGFELFGTSDFRMLAAVAAPSRGTRRFLFPSVATTQGWWTGVGLLSVGDSTGAVRITAYGPGGETLATSRSLELQPGQRSVATLESYFDSWPSAAAYVDIVSEIDIVGFELNGRFQPPALGSLPGVVPSSRIVAFAHTISNQSWDTQLTCVSDAGVSARVTFEAKNSLGTTLATSTQTIAPKGHRTLSVKSLFGSVPQGLVWVKAKSDVGNIAGYLRLQRVATGEFVMVATTPAISAADVGRSVAASPVGSSAARLASILRMEPVAGGVRVSWPEEASAFIPDRLRGILKPGVVVSALDGIEVRSAAGVEALLPRLSQKSSVSVELQGGARVVIDNPLRPRQ